MRASRRLCTVGIFVLAGVLTSGALCDDRCARVTGPAGVEIGTGFGEFEPLPSSLSVTRGLQGGSHLDAALRISGLYFEPLDLLGSNAQLLPTTSIESFDEADEAVGGVTDAQFEFRPDDQGRGVVSPLSVVFFEPDGSIYAGQTVTLRATVRDVCEVSAAAEAQIPLADFQ